MRYITHANSLLIFTMMLFASCSDAEDIPISNNNKPNPTTPTPDIPPTDDTDDRGYWFGSNFGFEDAVRQNNTEYFGKLELNRGKKFDYYPLYDSPNGDDQDWWDNYVEEVAYCGMDFLLLNCRGKLPDPKKHPDHGDPMQIKKVIEAMKRRGVEESFKIAIFDDCPASWSASQNLDKGYGYAALTHPYNFDEFDENYKYIWDYNIKLAFDNLPKKYWFTYNDRPIIIFWSIQALITNAKNEVGNTSADDLTGKLARVFIKLRGDFRTRYDADPILIVSDIFQKDSKINNAVDGIQKWFYTPDGITNTAAEHNGLTVGVGIPSFYQPIGPYVTPSLEGQQLVNTMDGLIEKGAQIFFIEGFTDIFEDAAIWRSISDEYKYPNQRLNIFRRYSSSPFPKNYRIECEACDFYYDTTPGNTSSEFRANDDIDIIKCDDKYYGWCVTTTCSGEWMAWKELPFISGSSKVSLRYKSHMDFSVKMSIGTDYKTIATLPSTNGKWSDYDICNITNIKNSYKDMKLEVLSGAPYLNYITINKP